MAPEVLFRPDVFELEDKGLHKLIIRSVEKYKEEEKELLWKNIILSGGSMHFKNIVDRIQKELDCICTTKPIVERQKHIMTSAWRGGKVLADTVMDKFMLTSEEYEEKGPSAIKSKFAI
eukprot:TRINITY_DN10697_c0_g3_i3.p2 TRINITY_DN10697_c0_g3~~TRINITY_DN10697_c0_g3_i3.p2  ORF type:complete len:119 (+),score=19.86 TRINITY_DN10697_c0_g3_i3:88-444(+)